MSKAPTKPNHMSKPAIAKYAAKYFPHLTPQCGFNLVAELLKQHNIEIQ